MELALKVMCRTVSTEPTLRPMYVPIPIPMATVPIFATDIGAINQLQLHFCCVLLFSPSANVICTLVKFWEVIFITENKQVDNKEYAE